MKKNYENIEFLVTNVYIIIIIKYKYIKIYNYETYKGRKERRS